MRDKGTPYISHRLGPTRTPMTQEDPSLTVTTIIVTLQHQHSIVALIINSLEDKANQFP